MTIDHITVRLYTCCKCGHKWTNWDSKNKTDGPIPLNCPSCRNVRWNQRYTNEDLMLVKRLEEQHLIKKDAEVGKVYSWYHSRNVDQTWSHFDFIAYDFLYKILPQPEIPEIRQVLKIPRTRIEERHELMLSIIRNRIRNKEKYEKEHFSKYSGWFYQRQKRHIDDIEKELNTVLARRRMKDCKHPEDLEILIALYKHPRWRELTMHEAEHLPGAKPIEWKAMAQFKKENEAAEAEAKAKSVAEMEIKTEAKT